MTDTIRMVDMSGNVVDMPREQALSEIQDPGSRYQPASNEEISRFNRAQEHGGFKSQVQTAAENVLPFDIVPNVVKAGLKLTGQDQTAEQYGKNVELRREENPAYAALGTATSLLDPAGIFGGVGKVGGIAERLATPVIENTLGKGFIGGAAKFTSRLATEGAALGAGAEIGRQSLDNLPYSGEAILDSAGKGMVLGAVAAPVVYGGLEATSFMMGKVKNYAKEYLDKVSGIPKGEGALIGTLERDALKTVPPAENPGIKHAVEFQNLPDGSLQNVSGKYKSTIPQINGNGLQLSSPESLFKAGEELGIRDLDLRYKTKIPEQKLPDFISEQKVASEAEKWIKDNYDLLKDADKQAFLDAQVYRDAFRKLEAPTEQDAIKLADSFELSKDLAKKYSPAADFPFDETLINKTSSKEISEYLKKLDYIDDGQKTFVFNRDILPEKITYLKEGMAPISGEAAGVMKQYDVSGKKISKLGSEDFNEVANKILEHYPNQMTKLSDVSTSFDYVANGVKQSFDQAGMNLQGVVDKAYNFASDLGLKTPLNNKNIAEYLEDNVLRQYTDKMTGNPLPGMSSEYNAVKKLAQEYRDTGYVTNKYGARDYQPLDVRQLYNERVRIDKPVNWDNPDKTALSNAYKNLRFYLDDNLVNTIKTVNPRIAEEYISAKKDWRILKSAHDIVGAAAEKAIQKSGINFKDLVFGGVLKGPKGAVAGLGMGAARDFLSNNSGNIQAYFARNLTEDMGKYVAKIDSVTTSFLRKTESAFRPMVKYDITTSENILRNDQRRLEMELVDRENFANRFISQNNVMFEYAPQTSQAVLQTAFIARNFLASKIPQNPYKGLPFRENQWAPSAQDVSKYLRYREAVERPSSILDQFKNGYVTPEAIEVLDQVYPQTKQILKEKILEKIPSSKDIPQEKRVLLFKMFGVPLDTYTSGALFAKMQSQAIGSVQQTLREQNQKAMPQALKIKPRDNTIGTDSLKTND